jgi:hypothetical protein
VAYKAADVITEIPQLDRRTPGQRNRRQHTERPLGRCNVFRLDASDFCKQQCGRRAPVDVLPMAQRCFMY